MYVLQAIYIEKFGGPEVLQFGTVPRPVLKTGQVLVEVRAAAVNPRDWLVREGQYALRPFSPGFPLILGSDVSGIVVEVGAGAARFRPGDAVFGMQTARGRMGAYAEYIAIAEEVLAKKPDSISHDEAAAAPCAALTAYEALVDIGRIGPGSRVLIIGASGGVGSFAVQIALARGAIVTAVTSAANAEFVQSLGVAHVVDYKTAHFSATVREQNVVFDTIGSESLQSCMPALARSGRYVTTIPTGRKSIRSGFANPLRILTAGRVPTAHVVLVRSRGESLDGIADMLAKKQLRSVIDSVYPLHAARAAQEKSRTMRTRGKLVLRVKDDPENAAERLA